MALGADGGRIFRLFLAQGITLVGAGIVAGLAAAAWASALLENLLYGVGSTDPWTYAAVATVLAVVGLLACATPAKRATRVDPMCTLRAD